MEKEIAKDKISKVFREVINVINRMDIEMQNKIPKDIIHNIYSNISDEDKKNIDINIYDIDNLMEDTKGIISILWSRYLCSDKEKEKWKQYDEYSVKLQSIK